MFPFFGKQVPIYQAPPAIKSLDTSKAEAAGANGLTGFPPIYVNKPVDWIDAQKYALVEKAVSECPVAQQCVDIRANKMSSVAVVTSGGAMGAKLMQSPNVREKTLSQAVYIWTNDLTIAGECWLMLDLSLPGFPQLYRARPDLIERRPKENKVIYDDGRITGQKNPRFEFLFDEGGDCVSCRDVQNGGKAYDAYLIRIFHHNPVSDLAGKGSVRSVLKSIKAWLELQNLIVKNIKRGGVAHSAVLKSLGMSDADFEVSKARLRDAAATASTANSMMVLPDVELVPTGSTFTELSIDVLKNGLEREIAMGLGVMPAMLGFADQVEYAAQRGAEQIFYKTTVKPEAQWLFQQLQEALRIHLNEPALTIEIDENNLDFTELDRLERARAWNELGIATVNELREQVGLKRVDGGDVVPGLSAAQTPDTAAQAEREVSIATGEQSDAERELESLLSKPRQVGLTADTSGRAPTEPSEGSIK